jgi:phage tail P2-like protein
MTDLLPSNATSQERALALAAERASALPVLIRSLWDPKTCPAATLPWLAWALSVETWDPNWGIAQKREIVSNAIFSAKRKGTKKAVIEALASIGTAAVLREWFEMAPRGAPHTFTIDIVGNSSTVAQQRLIFSEINRTKPLRSHFVVNYGVELSGSINIGGALRTAVFTRIDAIASYI